MQKTVKRMEEKEIDFCDRCERSEENADMCKFKHNNEALDLCRECVEERDPHNVDYDENIGVSLNEMNKKIHYYLTYLLISYVLFFVYFNDFV